MSYFFKIAQQYNTAHAEHRWPLLYHDRIVSYQHSSISILEIRQEEPVAFMYALSGPPGVVDLFKSGMTWCK